jgi:Trk-type K+ transport system membrane component
MKYMYYVIATKWDLLFYFPLIIFLFKYGDLTITGERIHNLGLCSALGAFGQGGISIEPHLL